MKKTENKHWGLIGKFITETNMVMLGNPAYIVDRTPEPETPHPNFRDGDQLSNLQEILPRGWEDFCKKYATELCPPWTVYDKTAHEMCFKSGQKGLAVVTTIDACQEDHEKGLAVFSVYGLFGEAGPEGSNSPYALMVIPEDENPEDYLKR